VARQALIRCDATSPVALIGVHSVPSRPRRRVGGRSGSVISARCGNRDGGYASNWGRAVSSLLSPDPLSSLRSFFRLFSLSLASSRPLALALSLSLCLAALLSLPMSVCLSLPRCVSVSLSPSSTSHCLHLSSVSLRLPLSVSLSISLPRSLPWFSHSSRSRSVALTVALGLSLCMSPR
jgi:hypothetical protein